MLPTSAVTRELLVHAGGVATSSQPRSEGELLSDHVRFGLLGPLEAWSGDVRIELGPPKRRVLLARLLIEKGRPVSVDRLSDDVWEGHPPGAAGLS